MSTREIHGVVFEDAETGQWVAICLEYNVATQGDSETHAFEMLKEAVQLHIEAAPPPGEDSEYQRVDSEPVVRRIGVRAPSVLNT